MTLTFLKTSIEDLLGRTLSVACGHVSSQTFLAAVLAKKRGWMSKLTALIQEAAIIGRTKFSLSPALEVICRLIVAHPATGRNIAEFSEFRVLVASFIASARDDFIRDDITNDLTQIDHI